MLTTILNSYPPPKCVIIQDSLSLSGKTILFSTIRAHLNLKKHNVHLFLFENSPEIVSQSLPNSNLIVYDCISDNNGWLKGASEDKFTETVTQNALNGIVVIDSVSHVVLEYGIAKTYRLLHNLLARKDNVQLLGLLHQDTLPNKLETLQYFGHISTLYLGIHRVEDKNPRVTYRCKKSGAKIINQTEEYYFTNELLQTKALDKIDAKVLLAQTTPEPRVVPENMSTFKISLEANEKKSREQLTLPYTKQANISEYGSGGGNVIYNLDDIDDWDEEDPDDDLDI